MRTGIRLRIKSNLGRKEEEMNYGPSLPPTGGGFALAGATGGIIWGISEGSALLIVVAVVAFCIISWSMLRLLQGEKRINSDTQQ